MSFLPPRDSFSHVAAVLQELAPGKRFLLAARPDVESLARVHGHCTDTDLVPYPQALVMHMQRMHRAARRRPGRGIDLGECRSIQRQLTWNRLIATVSGPLAAAYRERTLATGAPFYRMAEPRHQAYYFAHRTQVQGLPVEGYWVGRDLNPHTGEPLLCLHPVVDRPGLGVPASLRPGPAPQALQIPLLRTWEASVEAGAWEEAGSAPAGEAFRAAVLHYRRLVSAWEPVVALVFDTLTGPAGEAYERASTQAAFSQVGIRHLTLALDRGAVSARVI